MGRQWELQGPRSQEDAMGRLHCMQDPVPEAVGGDMQQLNQLGAQVGPAVRCWVLGDCGAGPEVVPGGLKRSLGVRPRAALRDQTERSGCVIALGRFWEELGGIGV